MNPRHKFDISDLDLMDVITWSAFDNYVLFLVMNGLLLFM